MRKMVYLAAVVAVTAVTWACEKEEDTVPTNIQNNQVVADTVFISGDTDNLASTVFIAEPGLKCADCRYSTFNWANSDSSQTLFLELYDNNQRGLVRYTDSSGVYSDTPFFGGTLVIDGEDQIVSFRSVFLLKEGSSNTEISLEGDVSYTKASE